MREVAITSYMFSPIPIARFLGASGERRNEERGRIDEVRSQPDEQLALQQRLANQAEVEVLQIAKAAVDHLGGAARSALAEVVALDQRDRVAARGGIEGHAGAGDPSAHDDDVERVLHRGDRLVAPDHSRNSITWSAGRRFGGRCSWTGTPRWISPTKRSPSGIPTAAWPSGVRRTSGVRQ